MVLLIALTAGAALGETVFVDRGVEVPGIWRPDRHLYVKGDLRIPRDRLDAFAEWIESTAPNWTVVLMENARGESFRDAAGQSFSGMDAVEHSLGKTLTAATAFGERTHPQTGEKNGAYFILYLEERKLAYHASEAYDNRRLGEDHWIGNLDSAAIAAMRGGGRVLDAAKDTVITIDRELGRRIRQESEARAREAERARRANEETAAAIAEARQSLAELETRIEGLRRDFNRPPGDLGSAPLAQWSARLDAAERSLAQGDPEAVTLMQSAATAIAGHISALFHHEGAPARFRSLRQALDALRLHEFSAAARSALLAGRTRLQAAEEAHARADSMYIEEFAAAETHLEVAVKSDRSIRGDVVRLEQLERRAAALNAPVVAGQLKKIRDNLMTGAGTSGDMDRAASTLAQAEADQRRAVRQREMLKAAGITGVSLAMIGLIFAGWWGNRRRRAPRARALDRFATWESTLRDRSGDLLELLDRTSKAIGTDIALGRSGWTGETLRLSRQTLADVDQLFILASGLDRVLEQTRKLLFPDNFLSAGVNRISSSRYEHALDLLDKEPVRFSPGDPLRPILQGREADKPRLFSEHSGKAEPFTLTFEQLNGAFRERASSALAGLGVLEHCWIEVERSLADLDALIAGTESAERGIYQQASGDGLLEIPGVFDSLLPAAREDQARAAATATTDPVAALRDELPRGAGKAADAAELCHLVGRIRKEVMPVLGQHARILQDHGRESGWIDDGLDDFSSRASALAMAAMETRIVGDLAILSADSDHLAETAVVSGGLAGRAGESCVPAMDAARLRIDAERQRLGGLLGLAAEKILCESSDADPSRRLEQAHQQHAAALAGIDLGDVAAASHALDACENFCLSAHEVMDATAAAFESAGDAFAKLDQEADRVAGLFPAAARVLEALEQQWSASTLRPASVDSLFPDAEASVSNHIHQAEAMLERSRLTAAAARQKHREGSILQAAELREDAAAACAEADEYLAGIHAHAAAIESVVAANTSSMPLLGQRIRQLTEAVNAPQITQPTMREFASARELADAAALAVQRRGASANPFEAARLLGSATASLQAIGTLLINDRQMHEEVARSLDAAERELKGVVALAARSRTDGIPDSPETARSLIDLELLERELEEARRSFAIPHGDWRNLDEVADRIAGDAARLGGRLSGELDLAEQSVREIHAALAKVRAAPGGIGASGAEELERARAMLSAGDYLAAQRFAAAATHQAEQAIRQAEAEALRRLRDEERQREAARRRRTSRTALGASSGFASRSRSGFSSRSGSSRSSFSSGSGTRRSGW